jgi:hypothetical protein
VQRAATLAAILQIYHIKYKNEKTTRMKITQKRQRL